MVEVRGSLQPIKWNTKLLSLSHLQLCEHYDEIKSQFSHSQGFRNKVEISLCIVVEVNMVVFERQRRWLKDPQSMLFY